MNKKKHNIQYYTMVVDKFMDLLTNSQKDFNIISDVMKDSISKYSIDEWDTKGVSDVIETFVIIRSLKIVLEKKLNDPPKEEIDFCIKNNIKDVLMTEAELFAIQSFVKSIEEQKILLEIFHKINISLH